MKWYTCCNDAALPLYGEGLIVACRSCLVRTSLEPILIYDGQPNALTSYLTKIGVCVRHHQLSFRERLKERTFPAFDSEWAAGVFLRFDLPLLESEDDYILYSDTDVMFGSNVTLSDFTGALGAAREILTDRDQPVDVPSVFNAGVMILNVAFWKALHPIIQELAVDLARGNIELPWYDQGILNHVVRGEWVDIGMRYNARPYFRFDPQASILHFQCLKPNQIANWRAGGTQPKDLFLFRNNIAAYENALRLYKDHLPDEAVDALVTACPNALLTNRRLTGRTVAANVL